MEFKKLNAPTLKELFVTELEGMILSGKLEIGSKLPSERELAESMQVSRAVVNAGIAEMARKEFLSVKPRIGVFVADYRRNGTLETLTSIMNYNGGMLRPLEIKSILEVRIVLVTLAAQLAIDKITEDELALLKSIVDQLGEAREAEEAAQLSFQFYHELAVISGNTLLPLIFYSFKSPVLSLWERYSRMHGTNTLYMNTVDLYEAIEERNKEKAATAAAKHTNDTINGKTQIYQENLYENI